MPVYTTSSCVFHNTLPRGRMILTARAVNSSMNHTQASPRFRNLLKTTLKKNYELEKAKSKSRTRACQLIHSSVRRKLLISSVTELCPTPPSTVSQPPPPPGTASTVMLPTPQGLRWSGRKKIPNKLFPNSDYDLKRGWRRGGGEDTSQNSYIRISSYVCIIEG